ncbi:MAG: hydroxyacid dehydrogenase [Candidatus Omnitrophica bacterium]|nr:hydroxyacid dehydrogenase [Candidatus Omnitrophota bacterium]
MTERKSKIKILLGTSTFSEEDKDPLLKLLGMGFEVVENPFKRRLTKDELINLLPGVSGIIAGLEPLDRDVLKNSELKVISRCGSGLSNVDLDAAKEFGVTVKNTPTAPIEAVAELTVGCLLSILRHIRQMDASLHNNKWFKIIGRQLNGMNVAVIGFGNIGQRVAQLLNAFGADIYAVDPAYSGKVSGFPVVDLDDALKAADVITLHCSGEKCLLGKSQFDLMKDGVYILNAARGGLIDEGALIAALDSGRVAGAWLDTFQSEPYSGALLKYKQVILTPHIGSYTSECRRNMEMEAVDNLIEALRKIL